MPKIVKPLSAWEETRIIELFEEGIGVVEISRVLHRAAHRVQKVLEDQYGAEQVAEMYRQRKLAAMDTARRSRKPGYRFSRGSEGPRVQRMKRYSEMKAMGIDVYKRVDDDGVREFAIAYAKMLNFKNRRQEG